MANENNLPGFRQRAGVNNTTGERKPVQPAAPKVTPEAQKPVQPKVEPQPQPKPEPAKPVQPKVEPKPQAKPEEPKPQAKPEPQKPAEPKVEPPKPVEPETVGPEPIQPAPEPVQPAPNLKKEEVPLGQTAPLADTANKILDTGKKHRNWTKTALPILLGALLIGGIIWAINAFKKKKQEKAKKAEEKATEKTEEGNKEAKEPEKAAEEKEDLKNVNLSFEYGNDEANLSAEDQKMAEAAAVTLAKHQEKNGQSEVVIAAGASKNGSEKYNQEISSRRGTGMKDILSAGGVKNLDIVHGVGARAATLDSNSSDKHAASRNDRTTIINAGLFTEKQYNDFYKNLKENAVAKGLTEAQADAYIEKFKAPSNGKVIDQFASNNPESGKVLSQLEKEEPAFKNKISKEKEFAISMGAEVKTNGETVVATAKENETKDLSRDETSVKKVESKEGKQSKIKVEGKETEKTLDTGKKVQENKGIDKDKKKEPGKETKDLSKVINKEEITKTAEKKKNTNQRG